MADKWEISLAAHPDPLFRRFIVEGICHGFWVGFNYAAHPTRVTNQNNMVSVYENSQVVDEYLSKERSKGRLLGPFSKDGVPGLQISPFGVIPKKRPGTWWLSAPPGKSINDGIGGALCSLKYLSVDAILLKVQQLGKDALLAKLNLREAYRVVPVHPHDRPPIAWCRVEGRDILDAALPFGFCSAPKLFNASANALQWVVSQQGAHQLYHYLDGFIVLGPRVALNVLAAYNALEQSCAVLGVPIAHEKMVALTTCLVFLGIEIDTSVMQARLPRDKLAEIATLVNQWRQKRACRKKELQSLAGHLCYQIL